MKNFIFLPLVLFVVAVPQTPSNETPPVNVLAFKYAPARHVVENPDSGATVPPASAMIAANKNFSRNARGNDPAGVRDPNADTVDGRSAELEKSVSESRAPKSKEVAGYSYRAKVKNGGKGDIAILFWEYQFVDSSNSAVVGRHQFLCGVDIRAAKDKELEGFSAVAPVSVVDAGTLIKNEKNPFQEKVVINRVEFTDGTIWQRADWSLKEVKTSYERALKQPWVPGMCKSL